MEGPLPCMDPMVLSQVVRKIETLSANGTLEESVPSGGSARWERCLIFHEAGRICMDLEETQEYVSLDYMHV